MMDFGNKKARILLVDDEDRFRQALARRLKKRGFSSMEVSGGEACLSLLTQRPMEVVLMDVKMPGINGIDTLKTIKMRYPETQVILLTGNAAVADGVEGIKAGAFDYLTKPVEIDHLVTKIMQAFNIIHLEKQQKIEQQYREQLEKKMIDTERLASLGTMATGVAHEINNPLAIINEAAGVIKTLLDDPEMKQCSRKAALVKCSKKIETSVKRARKVTHQLLGYVKKEDGRINDVYIRDLIQETLDLLKKDLKAKNIRIKWDMASRLNPFPGDPYRIRQILMNLLSNAVHALGRDGILTLAGRETQTDMIIDIQDNGIGIAKENLGKIFDPFFTTKSFYQGTGLGLFVVHKILESLEGSIEVESVPGMGTIFTITLPKRRQNKNGSPSEDIS